MNTEVPRRALPGAARVASLWVLLSALACGESAKPNPADARPVAPQSAVQKAVQTDLTASTTTTSPTFSSYIATLPPAQVTASITQTLEASWDPTLQSLNYPPIYPQGWSIEYYAGGEKLAKVPTTVSEWAEVSRVVARGGLDVEGVDGERQAIVSRSTAPRIVVRAVFSGGVVGDGWDVFFDPGYTRIFNVHHHNNLNEIMCRDLVTGTTCPGFPMKLTQTSVRSTGRIDAASNNFWQPTVTLPAAEGQPSKLAWDCVDLTNATRCARPVVVSEFTSANIKRTNDNTDIKRNNFNDHTDPVVIGRKMYTIGFVSGGKARITCLDMATGTECPGVELPENGSADESGLTAVGTRLYVVPGFGKNLDCYDSASPTWARCPGTWPQPVKDQAGKFVNGSPVWALPDATGEIQHICANNVCFKLDGSAHTLPPGFVAELQAHPVMGNANPIFQYGGGSSSGTKVAWPYSIIATTKSTWAMCWDMATDAKCADKFPVQVPVLYTTIFDPEQPDCLWTNTDNGVIRNFDVRTGNQGCTGASTRISFKTPVSVPRLSCDPASRVYQYKSFKLTSPDPSLYTTATLTVRDSNGQPLPAWSKLPIDRANPVVDLTSLSTNETGLTPSFDVSADITNANVVPASEIRVTTGAPPQLCWDLASPPFSACPIGPKLASTAASPPRETIVTAKGSLTNTGTTTPYTNQDVPTSVATANFDTCGTRLTAKVVSLSDGSPVAGATVFLLDSAGNPILDANGQPASAVSAADGSLEFPVWAGDYTLKMSGTDSYLPAFMNVTAGGSGMTTPTNGTVVSNAVTTAVNQTSHVDITVTNNRPTQPPPPAGNDEAWFQGSGCTAAGGAQSALVVMLVLGGLVVLRRRGA
ncbi:hypothetical protein [Cystobacter fuscus]|uniref:carboxypeptidase-like regulatory domain-containing protein n=1 Tax=Cystobacter fuscus TaxID=43 RepID=UPI002B27CD73|nr:carboxypeptidase regulatory-like domain-containing protein [Cystobacter fuscus]